MGRAFLRSPGGMAGLAILVLLIAVSILAPSLFGQAAQKMDVVHANQGASLAHLFGTDRLGRDTFMRLLVATPLSVGLGAAATLIAAVIGIPLGAAAALLHGRARSVALRTLDTMLAFPPLLVALFIGAILGAGAVTSAIGVGAALSFSFARVVSTQVMALTGRDFILAARLLGLGNIRLVGRHVLPNIAEMMIIQTTFALSGSIVAMSSLSFLGLGVQPPDVDWGRMLTEGVQSLYVTPWAALAPAIAIAVVTMATSFMGEALARILNPRLWVNDQRAREPSRIERPIPAPYPASASESGKKTVLEVRHLSVRLPATQGGRILVDDVSFSIQAGETVGIVGESGSGKTVTALAVAQLAPHPAQASGEVTLSGEPLAKMQHKARQDWLGTRLAFVFQDPMSSFSPNLRLGIQMIEGVIAHRYPSRREATRLAADRFREVNLPAPDLQLRRYPHELSGGMRQRAMIAMGLMNEPDLLIADEPTTALDVTIQAQIMELLARLNRDRGMSILLISHNIGLVAQNCDRVMVMYAGRIVEQGSAAAVTQSPRHPYTRALLDAVPDMGRPRGEPLADIPGSMPAPDERGTGCSFAPRCSKAFARCAVAPPLITEPDGHAAACWLCLPDAA